ncbi:hypothetical protein MNBD_GAMMA11-107 [hydrothermal vent metagenome]|uniref:DUF4382 domain-containing protein n=1 Tax=hydrothermal vent metagenome TaxID=652676 RepID=A0A3B0XA92_9ZZZZ
MNPGKPKTHLPQSLKRGLSILSLFALMLISFYGCDSGSGTTATQGDSELVISLTDAEGDFLSYTVDVQSIKMLKNNGAEIETLPLTTQLDFARYVEVTEFLTTATVPSGHYIGARIVLDFSNAVITVQGENGDAINAIPQDINGNPIGLLTLDLSFNGSSDFVIAPGIPAHITLDFDLDASNDVIINGSTATVIVKPVLIADTLLEKPKPHRLRGVLGRVNEADQSFNVLMRPFRHRFNDRFGKLNVQTSDRTSYEIDGIVYDSATGIAQLANLDPAAAVVVLGTVNLQDIRTRKRSFNALEVYAGSSVPWGDKDIVSGNVISRNDNTLVIRGATLLRTDGSFAFNDNVTVTLNENTRVVKQADTTNSYTIADVSVGQQVTISGRITDNIDLSLNADHVRMRFTNVAGSVVSVSPLAVNLQGINRRRIALFDFSGTGTDASSDADATNYEVDSGTLELSNLQIGAPLIVRGHVRPFASAPEDFTAQTLLDASNMRAHLVIGFAEGSANAVSSINDSALLLNLEEAGDVHAMIRAGISTDLLSLDTMPVIVPVSSGNGLFTLVQGQSIRVYTDFSSFQLALNGVLDGVTLITAVHANGQYDTRLNQLLSAKINIRLSTR